MSKILKNTTGSPVTVTDTGIVIGASSQYTIPPQDYLLWASSSNVITYIGNGTLVVNDGSSDLSISDGTDHIKDIFPKKMGVVAGDDFTPIGHVGDALKTSISAIPTVDVVSQDSAQYYCDTNQLYSAAADINCVTASTDNRILLFRNPSGSGKKIFVWAIVAGSTVTNVAIQFKVFANPTITSNGSTITAYPRNIGNSQPSAVGLVTSLPTITANGGFISNISVGQNTASSIIFDSSFSVCIQPGNSILLTGNPTSNNRNAAVSIIWAEVNV